MTKGCWRRSTPRRWPACRAKDSAGQRQMARSVGTVQRDHLQPLQDPGAQLPTSAMQLADPRYKGKLELAPAETDFWPIISSIPGARAGGTHLATGAEGQRRAQTTTRPTTRRSWATSTRATRPGADQPLLLLPYPRSDGAAAPSTPSCRWSRLAIPGPSRTSRARRS